jgi:hypothetical protein
VGNKRLQKVKNFKCLGCEISSENEKDIKRQPAIFAEGNVNNFKPNFFQKFSRMKVHNALLSFRGREVWTLKKGIKFD